MAGKTFIGGGSAPISKRPFYRRLNHCPIKSEIDTALDALLKFGTNQIFLGNRKLVQDKNRELAPAITPRELLASLYEKNISPELLLRALKTIESSLIDCFNAGYKMKIALGNLSTPKLRRKEIGEATLKDSFLRQEQEGKLRFLRKIEVITFEELTLQDKNQGRKGQLDLFE
jgi:hypothetical protein